MSKSDNRVLTVSTTIIGRLNYFLKSIGESETSFSEKTGLTKAFLRERDGGIVSSNLEKILYCYLELNPEWLLMGIGSMKRLHFDLVNIKIKKKGNERVAEIPIEQLLSSYQEMTRCLYLTLSQVQTQLIECKDQLNKQNLLIELLEKNCQSR